MHGGCVNRHRMTSKTWLVVRETKVFSNKFCEPRSQWLNETFSNIVLYKSKGWQSISWGCWNTPSQRCAVEERDYSAHCQPCQGKLVTFLQIIMSVIIHMTDIIYVTSRCSHAVWTVHKHFKRCARRRDSEANSVLDFHFNSESILVYSWISITPQFKLFISNTLFDYSFLYWELLSL